MSDGIRLTALIHGYPGAGKSSLANTAPGPRLLFDAEGRAEHLFDWNADPSGHTRQKMVFWDPRLAIPAESSDPACLTVVTMQTFADLELTTQWLKSGQHPFNSFVVDSLSDVQRICKADIAGVTKMNYDGWNTLLLRIEDMVTSWRDLRTNPIRPLWAVVILAGADDKKLPIRPMLEGSFTRKAAHHFDLVGFLTKVRATDGSKRERLTIDGFLDNVEAKDNTHVLSLKFGDYIWDPNISSMLATLNEPLAATPVEQPVQYQPTDTGASQ